MPEEADIIATTTITSEVGVDSSPETNFSSPPVIQKQRTSRRRDYPPAPPSPLKRTVFFIFTGFLFWFLVVKVFGLGQPKEPQIVYAQRYSKEYKFRPAASPIITETLKDGRIRLRGAYPTPTPNKLNEVVVREKKGKGRRRRRSKSGKARKPKKTA